jgi:hypothetical protein
MAIDIIVGTHFETVLILLYSFNDLVSIKHKTCIYKSTYKKN